jgi:carbon-monoxide dehydrogenase medium subunit
MQDFNFHRPRSVDGAKQALQQADEGKLLAGGQSLLPVMKLDLAAPSDLISLRDVPSLDGIEAQGDHLVLGAAATHAEVAESDVVRDAIPALAELAGGIGDPQVRNRGTLGGSVAHADPAADYPAALLALDATVITDGREIPARDYLGAMFETALEEDEIVTAVRFSVPQAAAYVKFANPASKYALVGVMVARTANGARVAVTGAGQGAFRSEPLEAALDSDFSTAAIDGLEIDSTDLLEDDDASAEYRAHLIKVMTKRAVEACG